MRPDASSFFFSFFFYSSIKHIWLKAVGRFGFLIHSDFLVEVVAVLRAIGGGGCGCGFLGLPLVVVKLGFDVAGFEEQEKKKKGTRVATIFFCVVSVGGSIILAKSEVKN